MAAPRVQSPHARVAAHGGLTGMCARLRFWLPGCVVIFEAPYIPAGSRNVVLWTMRRGHWWLQVTFRVQMGACGTRLAR